MLELALFSEALKTLMPVLVAILKKTRLFAVVLYDDRPSHTPVNAFLEQNGLWLDSLADSSNMFSPRTHTYSPALALSLASKFGVLPNQLPGVLVFTLASSSDRVETAAFLPLKAELFQEDLAVVERIFADLYSLFQTALASTKDSDELMAQVRQEVASLQRKQTLRPLGNYLRESLISIVKLPQRLLEAFIKSFGEGLAKSVTSGS